MTFFNLKLTEDFKKIIKNHGFWDEDEVNYGEILELIKMFSGPYIQKPPGLSRRRQSWDISNIFVVWIHNLQNLSSS
jgi:hypothetical protein